MPIESRATVSQKNKNRELRVESDSEYNRYESICVGQNNASPGKTKLIAEGRIECESQRAKSVPNTG
jgi:hypothetical protein